MDVWNKMPLQQELKGPSALFPDFPPHPGMVPTHQSERLSSAQGQDSWRSKDPADKRRTWGDGMVVWNQEAPAAGAGGGLHSHPAGWVHTYPSGWIASMQE